MKWNLELECTTRYFVFRFENERVLSIQKLSRIWTQIATMQNNFKSSSKFREYSREIRDEVIVNRENRNTIETRYLTLLPKYS